MAVMGAQYSAGVLSPDWKNWLGERCSPEGIRSIYTNFRAVVSSKGDRENDGFFVTAEEFRQVNPRTGQNPLLFL